VAQERSFLQASYTALKDGTTTSGRIEFIARLPASTKGVNLIERARRAAARRLRLPVSADVSAMANNIFFRIYNGEASASDLAQMGVVDTDSCELSYEVVEEAVRLLRQEWAVVQQEAECLIDAAGA
jgi:hypothetical protein